jgi:hypothetical protein
MKGEREKPLWLDIPFGDALRRFIQTDVEELPDSARLVGAKVGKKGRTRTRPAPQSDPVAKPPKDEVEPLD